MMFNWLLQNLANLLALGVVLALSVRILVRVLRNRRQGKTSCGCGGGCSGCSLSGSCHSGR